MTDSKFLDCYAVLQLSPSADLETVERVYRLLAKRYHPDNADSGDAEKFRELHSAYEILADAGRRAEFDRCYAANKRSESTVFAQSAATTGQSDDRRVFRSVLSVLFEQRRKNPISGGLGSVDLERILGIPNQELEFPTWYLKRKGWIEVLDSGQFAITVDGIDTIVSEGGTFSEDRMIESGIGSTTPGSTEAAAA
ncbi:MAG: DnaJ domain-containing protein [marine benthic group bacterium]|nr:DnaJ domain-containing protein [Gemmatimonadota bacterium]MCL7978300.1 DnaJ domain-containing protein [Gemmatimonadota bacterium]